MRLFPYQDTGVDWLSDRRFALLADEMGLGKSAQAIRAADNILAERICVVCPAVARINWEREFGKFSLFDRRGAVLVGRDARAERNESVICSYDLATRGTIEGDFDILILDEGHFLKNPEAQRTQAILGKGGLAHRSKRVWVLTGTPMQNHPGELWVYLRTFGRYKGCYNGFVEKFCDSTEGYGGHRRIFGMKKGAEKELRALLAPIMLQRTVAEVMPELPDIVFNDIVVEPGVVTGLTTEDWERLDREMGYVLKYDIEHGITDEAMAYLEATANSVSTLRRYNGLQKVQAVVELVTAELFADAYPKIVLFVSHVGVARALFEQLGGWGTEVITGATSAQQRQTRIDRFQTDPECRIIICNTLAAGTAITLTASNQVMFVEAEWSPGANAQAARRCRRIGSTKTVFVRFVGIANSIDEKIQRVLARKTRDIKLVFDGSSR